MYAWSISENFEWGVDIIILVGRSLHVHGIKVSS